MEPSFSERMSLKHPRALQINGMDKDLVVSLWNALTKHLRSLRSMRRAAGYEAALRTNVWTRYFKLLADEIPTTSNNIYDCSRFWEFVKQWYFDENRAWHERYDFLEFIAVDMPLNTVSKEGFVNSLNEALETETAGYRLINGQFAPITNALELDEVGIATKPLTTALQPVSTHLQQALKLLSNKLNPDYRNSMKESISAVESLCKLIARMPGGTLGPALEKTAKELGLNDDLREAFKKIYKYTSDDHGIRHALKNNDEPEEEDARFMLVACSAFINMLTDKARKQGKLPTAGK